MITSNGTADRDTIKKEEKWKHNNIFSFRHRTFFKTIKSKLATFFLILNLYYLNVLVSNINSLNLVK